MERITNTPIYFTACRFTILKVEMNLLYLDQTAFGGEFGYCSLKELNE